MNVPLINSVMYGDEIKLPSKIDGDRLIDVRYNNC
jgi:hypothetical protein